MKEYDQDKLIHNIKNQINILSYDSARSAGKAMTNAATVDYLYRWLDRLEVEKKVAVVPKTKAAAAKSGQ